MKTQNAYVQELGEFCPFCNSTNLKAYDLKMAEGQAWSECSCSECNNSWTDQYKLVGYNPSGESSIDQIETVSEPIDVVVTKIGIVDDGVDGRDEYLLLRNREGDLSPDQAIAFLHPLVYRAGRGPGSYFCTTVIAVQKEPTTDTVICTIEHRYDN